MALDSAFSVTRHITPQVSQSFLDTLRAELSHGAVGSDSKQGTSEPAIGYERDAVAREKEISTFLAALGHDGRGPSQLNGCRKQHGEWEQQ